MVAMTVCVQGVHVLEADDGTMHNCQRPRWLFWRQGGYGRAYSRPTSGAHRTGDGGGMAQLQACHGRNYGIRAVLPPHPGIYGAGCLITEAHVDRRRVSDQSPKSDTLLWRRYAPHLT